ncbi:MAG: DUF4173 domain-containing protein [Akkermansiaceae bacterium]|nr:DUF4173 domain-containing protein [Armatimonadota bacterium]
MNIIPAPSTLDAAQSRASVQTVPTPGPALREPLRFALFALGVGFLADALFRGGAVGLGVNVPIAVVSFLICLFLLARREGVAPKRAALALFVSPLLFFAAMLAVRANPSLAFCNLAGCGILTLLLLHFWGDGDPFTASFGAWLALPWKALGGTLRAAPPVLSRAGGQVIVHGERREQYAAVGRGLLISLPVLFLFGTLFANADAVFAARIHTATAWFFPSDWGAQTVRFVWTAATAFLATGGFAYALTRRETSASASKAPSASLGMTEAGVVLGTVSALFGAFLATQTRYLFGGDAHVQAAPNLTYAEYAHHGFAELNIIAILTLALIGGLKAITKRETTKQSRTFSLLSTILLALTFPLLASAFGRMTAYEAAYGATELRLFVDVFMAWLAVGLLWCGATLWRTIPGGIGVYVCAVGFLVSLNVLNPHREIARRNLERYQRTGRVDRVYLATLSEDALPELIRLRASSVPDDRTLLEEITGRDALDARPRAWGAWNLSRAQGRRLQEANKRSGTRALAPTFSGILETR